jgi:hypothetical protein
MLFILTFLIFMLAMTCLGFGLVLGRRQDSQAGCGNHCRCLPIAGERD